MQAYIVSDHEPIGNRVRQVLLFGGQDCPSSHVVSLDQAGARLVQEHPELVVVVLPPDIERGLFAVGVARGSTQARVLAVGPTTDTKLVLRTLRKGADDFVDVNDLENELEAALVRMASEATNQVEAGRLISVLSPNGGSGSSTLAVNVATSLAKEHKNVGLIDLKLETGDLAALLDLKPSYTLADLCQNISRLDKTMFERTLVRHDCGVQLLAPPRLYSDISQVTNEGIRKAVSMARTMFPYVVVDLDHSFREEQLQILQMSDIIMLVLRLDFTSLRNTRRTLDYIEQLDISRDRIRLVVNRYGQAKEVPAAKAEEALGMKIFHYVPEDAKTVNRANNNGVPVVIESPSARVSRSVAQLAMDVNGRHKQA